MSNEGRFAVAIMLRAVAVMACLLIMDWIGFSKPIILICGLVLFLIYCLEMAFRKPLPRRTMVNDKPSLSGKTPDLFWDFVLLAGIIFLGWSVSVLLSDDMSLTTDERIQRTEKQRAEFEMKSWFESVGPPTSTNHWWLGTVQNQRPLVNGLYQVKVIRDSDKTIILALSSREHAENEKVEVGLFRHRGWNGAFPSYTQIIK